MTSELTDGERAVLDGYFAQKQAGEIAALREQVRVLRDELELIVIIGHHILAATAPKEPADG